MFGVTRHGHDYLQSACQVTIVVTDVTTLATAYWRQPGMAVVPALAPGIAEAPQVVAVGVAAAAGSLIAAGRQGIAGSNAANSTGKCRRAIMPAAPVKRLFRVEAGKRHRYAPLGSGVSERIGGQKEAGCWKRPAPALLQQCLEGQLKARLDEQPGQPW